MVVTDSFEKNKIIALISSSVFYVAVFRCADRACLSRRAHEGNLFPFFAVAGQIDDELIIQKK